MGKCKDCDLFKYTTVGALLKEFSDTPVEFDGLCYFHSPPWEPHDANSDWDMEKCPHYLEALREETEEYDTQMRDILQMERELE